MSKLALISVSDTLGLVDFVKILTQSHEYSIIATEDSANFLKASGIKVSSVLTAIDLSVNNPKIDLAVINLYPFEQSTAHITSTLGNIEAATINESNALRSAAIRYPTTTVICDPSDYGKVAKNLKNSTLREELALKAFRHSAKYDQAIIDYLESQQEPSMDSISGMPRVFNLSLKKERSLPYGENPHQQAALYGSFSECFEQIQGKELSYNNILNISAATYLIGEFEKPSIAVLEHTNPYAVASALNIQEACESLVASIKEKLSTPTLILNQTIDEGLADTIINFPLEVIIAPCFTETSIKLLSRQRDLKLILAKDKLRADSLQSIRSVAGGLLVQDRDHKSINAGQWEFVSKTQPSKEEETAMLFAMRVLKHTKSKAQVYAKGEHTLAIETKQTSQAILNRCKEPGAILASDSLNRDAVKQYAQAGITSLIQAKGSKETQALIEAADKNNIALTFAKKSHLLH